MGRLAVFNGDRRKFHNRECRNLPLGKTATMFQDF